MSLFFLLSCGIGGFVSPMWMVHLHFALPLCKLMAQVVPALQVFCVLLGRVDRLGKADLKNQFRSFKPQISTNLPVSHL